MFLVTEWRQHIHKNVIKKRITQDRNNFEKIWHVMTVCMCVKWWEYVVTEMLWFSQSSFPCTGPLSPSFPLLAVGVWIFKFYWSELCVTGSTTLHVVHWQPQQPPGYSCFQWLWLIAGNFKSCFAPSVLGKFSSWDTTGSHAADFQFLNVWRIFGHFWNILQNVLFFLLTSPS